MLLIIGLIVICVFGYSFFIVYVSKWVVEWWMMLRLLVFLFVMIVSDVLWLIIVDVLMSLLLSLLLSVVFVRLGLIEVVILVIVIGCLYCWIELLGKCIEIIVIFVMLIVGGRLGMWDWIYVWKICDKKNVVLFLRGCIWYFI